MGSKERKAREKDRRREDILEAGEQVFLRKGLQFSTMDEVARECELAKGTLYLYFSSKEQLYLSIVLRALTVMCDTMVQSQKGAVDPFARLERIGMAQLRFYDENPELFRLISRVPEHEFFTGDDIKDVAAQIHRKNAEIWQLVTDVIVDGMKKGIFREDTDPVEISLGLHAISMAMTVMIDQHKTMNTHMDHAMPADAERLREIMMSCCGRLIWTMVKEPEKYKDKFPK